MKWQVKIIIGIAAVLLAVDTVFFVAGCNTTPQRASYTAAGGVSITVEAALRAYNVAASQGKTTVTQNQAVKAAYLKYQAAFSVLCDAGAAYAATSGTNSPIESALQQATMNASQSITDLINLVQSFGVKL